jgi:hypothetical protein
LRTETLSHKFEKATERSSFQILGGVIVLVCKLVAAGGLGVIFMKFQVFAFRRTSSTQFLTNRSVTLESAVEIFK